MFGEIKNRCGIAARNRLQIAEKCNLQKWLQKFLVTTHEHMGKCRAKTITLLIS